MWSVWTHLYDIWNVGYSIRSDVFEQKWAAEKKTTTLWFIFLALVIFYVRSLHSTSFMVFIFMWPCISLSPQFHLSGNRCGANGASGAKRQEENELFNIFNTSKFSNSIVNRIDRKKTVEIHFIWIEKFVAVFFVPFVDRLTWCGFISVPGQPSTE